MIKLFFFSMLILLFLNGCNSSNTKEDIFQSEGSYVGDNSAVGNIAHQLPGGEHLEGFELKTKEKPYGIILNYNWIEAEKKYKETVIYNATFLFTLVQNADWITFNFDNQRYKVTKEDLQNWYGKRLSEYTSEEELRKLTQKYIEDENKVNELFK
ncbi:DUF4825 domain-containing protein [Aneurinibacillus tyrosinisolvens]|uniref:DUF4825 domain-containing protein n=1 Tax=Aneurinibacillus tyrosinisolvens TaxID=1443435 RepID=UPI0034E25C03